MQAESLEVLEFLQQHPPFSFLPEEELHLVASQVEVSYFKAGTQILTFGQEIDALHLVRSGSVEVFRRNGDLYNRLSEGGFFGEFGLLRNRKVRFPVQALEDTLVYLVPEAIFTRLFDEFEEFADAVEVEDKTRVRQAVARREDANELMTASVATLITREPVTVAPEISVREAAEKMTADGVSSLLVIGPEEDNPELTRMLGIVTDRDIRSRLVAEGLPDTTLVSDIMSADLISIDHRSYVFEAMLLMLRHNLHHLPVSKDRLPIGMIGISDIIRYESNNSLFVVRSIFRQTQVEGLVELKQAVRDCFVRLVREGANSRMIGSSMALIGRSFKQRLLELAEAELGPPPVAYCFLALGSMAREEQLIVTDQDNALILHDHYDPAVHEDYFARLAQYVCDGLDACGYAYCTGGIMATNPKWRMTRSQWQACFAQWIDRPNPESLLHSSIFFDLQGVWGKTEWADQLNDFIARKAKSSAHFLACIAHNALLRTPPLGFFKDFVVEKDGRQQDSINMKRRGTAPLADLVRVHALAAGSRSQNSFDRLQDIIDTDLLPPGRGQNLVDALELISMVRIRHQALSLEAGDEPDNNVLPERLSDFERKHLKDAFQLLSHAQKFMKFRYPPVGRGRG